MSNVQIRKMTYDDIPLICKADNDESESNIEYLKNNLDNQDKKNVQHCWHSIITKLQDMYSYIMNANGVV